MRLLKRLWYALFGWPVPNLLEVIGFDTSAVPAGAEITNITVTVEWKP